MWSLALFVVPLSLTLALVDIDECLENISGCNQTCVNDPGSYYCECDTNEYVLLSDRHSCGSEWVQPAMGVANQQWVGLTISGWGQPAVGVVYQQWVGPTNNGWGHSALGVVYQQ